MDLLIFKDYFNALSQEDKNRIRQLMVPAYMEYSTFYYKLSKDKFSNLELEKLSVLTGKNFKLNETN